MMKKSARLFLVLAILAGAGIAGWLTFAPANQPQSNQVISAPVTRNTVEQTVLAQGTVKPRRMVAVGAQVSGRITSVHVELGQQVRAGDLVAEIDSVTQENALRNARASLMSVRAQHVSQQAQLALAERTLERQTQMRRNLTVTQTDFDAAEEAVTVAKAQMDALDAQVEQATIAIETAEANLAYTRITAPIDGTVLAIVSQEGQTVNAAQSAPTIVVLGQLNEMRILAQISEADIVRVQPGQPVWFTILGEPDRIFEATLESVEPAPQSIVNDSSIGGNASASSASSEAIYYNGYFNVPNADGRLRTYMTAQVHIVLGRAQDVLTLPSSALSNPDGDNAWSVRVINGAGQIEPRRVTVGLNDKVNAEVISGLAEGDRVVTGQAAGGMSPGAGSPSGPRRMSPMGGL